MITINLHGVLAYEVGKKFKIYANNAFFALKSLDCISRGFLNKLKNLQKNGLSYSIIVDNEWIYDKDNFLCLKGIKQIDIVPNICGGFDFLGALFTGLMVGLAVFTGGASIGLALAMGALATGLSILSQVLNKQKATEQKSNTQFTGGQTSASAAQSKSYAFTNTDNLASQNTPVPIGYGRMRIGTKIIQTSIKSYPTNESVYTQFSQTNNPLDKLSVGFIS